MISDFIQQTIYSSSKKRDEFFDLIHLAYIFIYRDSVQALQLVIVHNLFQGLVIIIGNFIHG